MSDLVHLVQIGVSASEGQFMLIVLQPCLNTVLEYTEYNILMFSDIHVQYLSLCSLCNQLRCKGHFPLKKSVLLYYYVIIITSLSRVVASHLVCIDIKGVSLFWNKII